MKKTWRLCGIICLLILALFLTACHAQGSASRDPYEDNATSSKPDATVSGLLAEQKIIKTVYQTVQTTDYDVFLTALGESLQQKGGYISSSQYSGDKKDKSREAMLTLRIPAQQLEDVQAVIRHGATVTRYKDQLDDVTTEYIDVESRIAVLAAEEQALLDMLGNAPDVQTLLAVRKQLSEVQGDLSSLRAQKENNDKRISYSTVYLTVYEKDVTTGAEDAFFWSAVGTSFVNSLFGLGRGMRSFGIWFLGRSPYILLIAAVVAGVFLLVCWQRRKNKK